MRVRVGSTGLAAQPIGLGAGGTCADGSTPNASTGLCADGSTPGQSATSTAANDAALTTAANTVVAVGVAGILFGAAFWGLVGYAVYEHYKKR
jgi:hypothetical protein